MGKTVRFLILAAILVLGAALFACSSSDDDDDDNATEEPVATEMTDDGEPTADTGDDDGDTSGDLDELTGAFGTVQVKVTYTMSSSGAGEDFSGTMTLYTQPPDSWRMDLDTADGAFTMISTGGTAYMCAEDAGTGQCFESPVGDLLTIPFLNVFADPNELSDLVDEEFGDVDVDTSSREIAGQDATCFSASGTVDGESGEGEYCFRDDGVLLSLTASGSGFDEGGEFSIVATDVSDSVSDSDFEPIYEVLDIGNIVP